MVIKKSEFITSVARAGDFLTSEKPIIAIAGKSNVGKSSFINALAGKNKLAKTSNTPGRTRLINYFDFGEFILADLPGYGFADVSKTEKQKWGKLMEDFFAFTEIKHVFSLIDIRHKPTKDDMQMITYLYAYSLPFTLIATKADKLGKSKIKPAVVDLASFIKVGTSDILPVSNDTKYGFNAVYDRLDKVLSVVEEDFDDDETED